MADNGDIAMGPVGRSRRPSPVPSPAPAPARTYTQRGASEMDQQVSRQRPNAQQHDNPFGAVRANAAGIFNPHAKNIDNRNLNAAGVSNARLEQVQQALDRVSTYGADAEQTVRAVTALSESMADQIAASSIKTARGVYDRSYGIGTIMAAGAGAIVQGVSSYENAGQAAVEVLTDEPEATTLATGALALFGSATHGAAQAAALLPDPTRAGFVENADSSPVSAKDKANSFEPFSGLKSRRDMTSRAATTALAQGAKVGIAAVKDGLPASVNTAINLGKAVMDGASAWYTGRTAAEATFLNVAQRQAGADMSGKFPVLIDGNVAGHQIIHPNPIAVEGLDGRSELGRIELYDRSNPTDGSAPVAQKHTIAVDRLADGSGAIRFIDGGPETVDEMPHAPSQGARAAAYFKGLNPAAFTSSTFTKLASQAAGTTVAYTLGRAIGGIEPNTEGATQEIKSSVEALTSTARSAAAVVGSQHFISGFQRNANEVTALSDTARVSTAALATGAVVGGALGGATGSAAAGTVVGVLAATGGASGITEYDGRTGRRGARDRAPEPDRFDSIAGGVLKATVAATPIANAKMPGKADQTGNFAFSPSVMARHAATGVEMMAILKGATDPATNAAAAPSGSFVSDGTDPLAPIAADTRDMEADLLANAAVQQDEAGLFQITDIQPILAKRESDGAYS